uniref:Twin-arginine translocation signal domain-containing protein n=1 Tax=candidate division CPR3 bacterium TaxID=2268181 RepID=A0A7C4QXL7_UNCC3
MRNLKKILFLYTAFLTFSLFFYGLRQAKTLTDVFLVMVFSFPTLYFIFDLVKLLKFSFISEKNFVVLTSYLKLISFFNYLILSIIIFLGLFFQFNFLIFVVFLPLPVYFWLTNFVAVEKIEEEKKLPKVEVAFEEKKDLEQNNLKQEIKKINDPLRRQFIKMLGVGGVGLFISTLLNPQKAEAAFFGSVPGPGTVAIKDSSGHRIDPAIKKPTDGYSIAQIDTTSPSYYGYQDKDGNWYIVKESSDGSFRYCRGYGNFSSSWTSRSSLSYDYFENVF